MVAARIQNARVLPFENSPLELPIGVGPARREPEQIGPCGPAATIALSPQVLLCGGDLHVFARISPTITTTTAAAAARATW